MKLNRKSVMLGLAGLGLAGILAGGASIAAAAASGTTTTTPTATSTATAPAISAGHMSGMAADMSNMASGMYGMAFGENSAMATAMSYLGLSQTDLQAQLQAGRSLADVAKTQGKSLPGLEAAMVTAMGSELDANTALTAEQRAAILTQMKTHIDSMVNATQPCGSDLASMGGRMSTMGQ